MRNRIKKVIVFMLALVFVLSSLSILKEENAKAGVGYPFLVYVNDNGRSIKEMDARTGSVVNIRMQIWPEFRNEKYSLLVYDSSGQLVASCEDDYYNQDGFIGCKKITVTWDTTGKAPDVYTVETHLYFYSLYEWHESPSSETLKINLVDHDVSVVTPTPTPVSSYQGTKLPPFDASTGGTGVDGFVERLYSVALGRSSDPSGKADWVSAILTGRNTGADAARGFILSTEFMNKGYSNTDFVEVLYRTFFNRTGDATGKAGWINVLNNGGSREEVISGFINSTEWANLCLSYGIASGGTGTPNITIQPSQQVLDFATRLYTTCLGRNADSYGLNDWASQLANRKISGSDAAHGFFFSQEFINGNYSNDEYVTRLYRTFMGREPDPSGFADWVGQLNNGASRESVFQGFAGSQEWAGICAEYGILK